MDWFRSVRDVQRQLLYGVNVFSVRTFRLAKYCTKGANYLSERAGSAARTAIRYRRFGRDATSVFSVVSFDRLRDRVWRFLEGGRYNRPMACRPSLVYLAPACIRRRRCRSVAMGCSRRSRDGTKIS